MGTPEFAVPALKDLIESPKHEVVALYTKSPAISGRGLNIEKSATQLLAEQYKNISIMTPRTLRNDDEVNIIKNFNADVIVVAAYGLILPASVLNITRHGCINIHPSDLPRWRGAAPIQRSIMAGDKETAMCIMRMDEGIDSGDIVMKEMVEIEDSMTANELSLYMANLGSQNLLKVLDDLENGTAVFHKQSDIGITYANKINRSEERIVWNRSAEEIYCQIKAFAPRPCAHFIYNNERIKIVAASWSNDHHDMHPGTVVDAKLTIACGKGFLTPTLLQREGRKMIYTDAFLRGYLILPETFIS